MKLEAGMTLWYVRRGRGFNDMPPEDLGCEVRVVSVGRRWAALDNDVRIDMATLAADGGDYQSPGQCYVSQVAFQDHVRLNMAWHELRRLVQWETRPPKGVTLAQVHNAMRSLFKDIK